MNHATDESPEPGSAPDWPGATAPVEPTSTQRVEELTPDGGPVDAEEAPPAKPPAPPVLPDPDEDPPPELVWYVLKVQSSREDTIRDALERRVKIQGLQRFFNRIVVPTEKITEIRNNKKRVVERKSYPGYIMVEMELNEKTWFVVRETPGVGDFVGAHPGNLERAPTPMSPKEVQRMLGPTGAGAEAPVVAEKPRGLEVGNRVRVVDGTFNGMEGIVKTILDAVGKVQVEVSIFGRPVAVDLEYYQVEEA